jgi:response regulator NasT
MSRSLRIAVAEDEPFMQNYLTETLGDLGPAIAIAVRRFEEFQAMCREASGLRQALEDRKLIERAKGIVMKRMALSEPDAFRHLQKTANDKRCKVVEIARMLLNVEEILAARPQEPTQ